MRVMIGMALICGSVAALAQGDLQPSVDEARGAAVQLGGALKQQLKGAMQQGGPLAALEVCQLKAPVITEQISLKQGAEVGRTALKVRNPNNRPDAWEQATLEEFSTAIQQGANPATLERYTVVNRDDQPQLRYMKAIPTGELCLVCHGSELSPEVARELQARYPEDQATGFRVGMLRGAFTVTLPLDEVPAAEL